MKHDQLGLVSSLGPVSAVPHIRGHKFKDQNAVVALAKLAHSAQEFQELCIVIAWGYMNILQISWMIWGFP